MQKITLINAVNVLSGIKITKIKNDKVKFTLIADYRALRKASREYEEDQREIVKQFQDDHAGEEDEVKKLRSEGKPVTGHDDFLKAEKDINKVLAEMSREECEVEGLKKVKIEDFLKAVTDADLTMEDIANLDGIVIE
ncbi:MAG: hypothetical protein K6E37_05900 [Bacteroidales bacterium]|nr:hypothetical protein [Bacteroidales bacterium]